MKFFSTICLAGLYTTIFAADLDAAKHDPAMARTDGASAVTNGVSWIDGRSLPMEGRAFDDTEFYYDRLPQGVSSNVNAGVRNLQRHSAGMQFRFSTDSAKLRFRWIPHGRNLAMDHMPSTGVSGIDVYRFDRSTDQWRYVKTGRIWDANKGGSLEVDWIPGTPCLVNLPLYNGVKSFQLGIDEGSTVQPLPPRRSGVEKPVVFYGTSITQGGCCSRPGLAYPSAVGRALDVPIVNLGFSGSAKCELEVSDLLTRIEASCYVIDCIRNMSLELAEKRFEPFVRNLLAKRPGVPIVLAEGCNVYGSSGQGFAMILRNNLVSSLYRKLVAEGYTNVSLLAEGNQLGTDGEATVDGVHPNDLGMARMTEAFSAVVRNALKLNADGRKTSRDEDGRFRILYWNIQNGMWDGQRDDYARFVAFVKSYDPDLCVWCEAQSIWRTDAESALLPKEKRFLPLGWERLARRYGHEYVFIGGYRDGYPQVMTSKRPLIPRKRLVGPMDRPIMHGAGHATIDVGGRELNVVSLHTWPQRFAPGKKGEDEQRASSLAREGDRYRRYELEQICRETIDLHADATNELWMMLGDFNSLSRTDNAVYRLREDDAWFLPQDFMATTPYREVLAALHPNEFSPTTFNGRRIDFVYATAPLLSRVTKVEVVKDAYTKAERSPGGQFCMPSDHYPILVDISLK